MSAPAAGSEAGTAEAKDCIGQILQELPRRLSLPDCLPEVLAPLVRMADLPSPVVGELRLRLTDLLLDLTVRQAVQGSAFYSRWLDLGPDEPWIGWEELPALPLLDRQSLETAGADVFCRHADFAFCTYTSGSTGHRPLIVSRSQQEQRYLIRFFNELRRGSDEGKEGEPRLILQLADWCNGQRLQIPGRGYAFPVSLAGDQGFHQAVALLQREFQIDGAARRISAIAGSFNDLIPLTAYLAEEGLRDLAGPVRQIQGTAQYLTDHSRVWLEDFWGCPVENRFSLSEMFFGASRCPQCGRFHFDSFGAAEVVAWQDGGNRRIESGRGVLALTAFYPFTQMTPLIRYLSGDLVEVAPAGCSRGRAFRFLGRSNEMVDLQPELGAGWFLAGGEVYEAVDPVADLRRQPFDVNYPMSFHAGIGGKPRFRLGRGGAGTPRLELEVRYPVSAFPQRALEVECEVRERLGRRLPWLSPLLESGHLQVVAVSPGHLIEEPRIDW